MSRPTFAQALAEADFVYAPGVWDGLSALLAKQAGFPAVCASGYAFAASMGMPDSELYSMTEMVHAVGRMAETGLPIIADIDTGFGNALNVMRTVREFESAGAAALFLEDQQAPKKCPVLGSTPPPLISIDEAVGKVKAALDARRHESTLIVARTDGRGEDALQRAIAYAEAGADMILPTSPSFSTLDGFKECHTATGKPLVLSLTPGTMLGREATPEMLPALGCQIAMLPFQALYGAVTGMRQVLAALRENANAPAGAENQITNPEFSDLIGFHELEELLDKYAPSDAR